MDRVAATRASSDVTVSEPTSVQQLWILDIYGHSRRVPGHDGNSGRPDRPAQAVDDRSRVFCGRVSGIGFLHSPEMLIASRALLGVAGSTLAPSTLALISNMFRDPKQMGAAVGIWAAGFTLGAILGPIVGPTHGGARRRPLFDPTHQLAKNSSISGARAFGATAWLWSVIVSKL